LTIHRALEVEVEAVGQAVTAYCSRMCRLTLPVVINFSGPLVRAELGEPEDQGQIQSTQKNQRLLDRMGRLAVAGRRALLNI
jgi:hypothetical protein